MMHLNYSFNGGGLGAMAGLATLLAIASWMAYIVIHLAFSVAVLRDADRVAREQRLWFVPPFVWWLATLLGGPLTAAIYWAMHHSELAVPRTSPENSRNE